ncbi:MAG: zinc-ribbon domain-containing protein [Desulfohalobiaceae bacterium]|nr:zinc-ribbon domain-containing protein [Desulfohalobiaceae bacterium]
MLIDCPKCGTRFRISRDKLRPEGTKLKCSRCEHVFQGTVYDALIEEGETREDHSYPSVSGLDGIGGEEQGRAPRRKRKWLWLLVVLILVAAAVGYMFLSGITARISFLQEPPRTAETGLDQRLASEEAVQDITLRNVNQYMVQNKHIGSMLVIEGKAENESGGPKTGIRLRATVFDQQGNKLRSKEFFCGKSVSLAQLQSSSKKELESAYTSDLARLKERQRVGAGEAVPFMVLFFSPPQEMAEFSLKVLGARLAGTS